MADVAAWLPVAVWTLLMGVRFVLALRTWRPPQPVPLADVVVLQPILAGDPHLGDDLAANLSSHPTARFRWLVDTADAEGLRLAHRLAGGAGRLAEVREFGVAPPDANPKVFKLARAVDATDELVAVLDDDTVLPEQALGRARAALADGDLVTGVPFYAGEGSVWSRLVAAFVNGNALLTYLPLTAFGRPVTLNGMFYLTTRDALQRAGGFAAVEGLVCDDYEVARSFRRAGMRLVQASVPVRVRTTVPDARAYLRLMRRWMVFTLRLLRAEANPPIVLLVALPTVLPLLALVIGLAGGAWLPAAAMVVALAAKAAAMAALRRRWLGTTEKPGSVLLEMLADLVQPLHALAALLRPGRIVWRGRAMVIDRSGRVRATS